MATITGYRLEVAKASKVPVGSVCAAARSARVRRPEIWVPSTSASRARKSDCMRPTTTGEISPEPGISARTLLPSSLLQTRRTTRGAALMPWSTRSKLMRR